MKVLYKWKECFRFDDQDAYYLEIHKSEITDKLITLLEKDKDGRPPDDQYYEQVNNFTEGNITSGLSNKDCIYVLIDKNVTTAILCEVYYPYSGQWGAYCPFQYLYTTNDEVDDYLKNTIEIEKLSDIKNIEEIIKSKGSYFLP